MDRRRLNRIAWRLLAATLLVAVIWSPLAYRACGAQQDEVQQDEAPRDEAQGFESLLPSNTVAYVSVASLRQWEDRLKETTYARLLRDPSMKAFNADVQGLASELRGRLERITATPFDELKSLMTGEVSLAVVATESGGFDSVVLADVSGGKKSATELLNTIAGRLVQKKIPTSRRESGSCNLLLVDVPKSRRPTDPQTVVFAVGNDLLGITNRVSFAESIAARAQSPSATTLGHHAGFRFVMDHCRIDDARAPFVRWFIDPIRIAQQLAVPKENDVPRQVVASLKKHGFDAVRGVGGVVDFASDEYAFAHQTVVHAPRPYQKTMAMFAAPQHDDLSVPSWVPADVSSVSVITLDAKQVFKNYGVIFDEAFADGIEGTFEDLIEDIKKHLKVDLRTEVIELLGPKIILLGGPIQADDVTNERLAAIEISRDREAAVAKALQKLLKDDRDVKQESVDGFENELWVMGHSATMVAHGHLFIASSPELVKKVLTTSETSLARSAELGRVSERLNQYDKTGAMLWSFARTDREVQPIYQLLRSGRTGKATTIFDQSIDFLLAAIQSSTMVKADNKVKAIVDFRKLPDFAAVRKHFGLKRIYGQDLSDGWRFVGFVTAENEVGPIARQADDRP